MDKYIDSITGTYNRRYLNNRLPKEFIRSQIKNKDSYIIMVDIDQIGDIDNVDTKNIIMAEVVTKLKNAVDENKDWIVRYNKERLVVVVGEDSESTIYDSAENIRKCLEGHSINIGKQTINITATLGVSRLKTVHVEEEIKGVMDKLCKAINLGRNRIVLN